MSEERGIVEKLRGEKPMQSDDFCAPVDMITNQRWMEEAADTITALEQRVGELEEGVREAYEIYAGSDGFIPETAGEGYLQEQVIGKMVRVLEALLLESSQ